MIPITCQVKHDPPQSYGDCVRACIASILEREDVPHFYHDGDGEQAFERMRLYLAQHRRIPAYFAFGSEKTFAEVMREIVSEYGGIEIMLFCQNRDGDHCVICQNGKVIHDPAWYKTAIVGPHSSGVWIAIILARL